MHACGPSCESASGSFPLTCYAAADCSHRTYKPSESDMEDDDDDEEDDDEQEEGRPAWWDEDDQEDGIKGQDIVEPDYEDLSSIIRIDEARIPFSIPRDE